MFRLIRYRLGQYRRSNHLGLLCLLVAAGLFVSGALSITHGLADQRFVAKTKSLGTIPDPAQKPPTGHYMSFALPTAISIPTIGVSSPLITVGKTADGAIDTPQAPDFDKAAWYHDSPAPGQYGAAVIVGHIDSFANDNGASVFYNLAKLKPGDVVSVTRSDNTTANFKVYATRQFDRHAIPTEQVYAANSTNAELRLITCAGTFDENAKEYTSNTVIFAQLI